jgi:hypothetical protein
MENKSYFSLSSLKIDLYFNETYLSTATWFIIKNKNDFFLVTNNHVFSWKDFGSNKRLSNTLAIPNKIAIWHHIKWKVWYYIKIFENLIDENNNELYINWKQKINVDIWILKLRNLTDNITIYDIDYLNHREFKAIIRPWHPMLIVWFPYWLSSYSLMPIWKNWILASELDFDFKWFNCFLIDAWTRGWMSWSPVFAYFYWWNFENEDWKHTISSQNYYKFVWIYSSRLIIPNEERKKLWKENFKQLKLLWSDIWQVWKENNIDILLNL